MSIDSKIGVHMTLAELLYPIATRSMIWIYKQACLITIRKYISHCITVRALKSILLNRSFFSRCY